MSIVPNPFNGLLEETNNDPVREATLNYHQHPLTDTQKRLQERYTVHRTTRNAAQKSKLLAPTFNAFNLDVILQRLEDPTIEPGFVDPRHCLVFWARPPAHVKSLIAEVQRRIRVAAPSMYQFCRAYSRNLFAAGD